MLDGVREQARYAWCSSLRSPWRSRGRELCEDLARARQASPGHPYGPAPSEPTPKACRQERRWAESACDGNDVVHTLLADDFQGTSPSGKRYSKPTTAEKPSARDCKLGEVKIRFFGDNLAIAYGSESQNG